MSENGIKDIALIRGTLLMHQRGNWMFAMTTERKKGGEEEKWLTVSALLTQARYICQASQRRVTLSLPSSSFPSLSDDGLERFILAQSMGS